MQEEIPTIEIGHEGTEYTVDCPACDSTVDVEISRWAQDMVDACPYCGGSIKVVRNQ